MKFGGALFFDYGKITKSDFSTDIYSYGFGFRIGFEKATQNIIRLDIIRTKSNDWELSVGTGQYFHAGTRLFMD
jgi:hypothetical protein